MRVLALSVLIPLTLLVGCGDDDDTDTDGDADTDADADADQDSDGLSDADEASLGTDPENPDTDGDGFLDGEEVESGSNPSNQFSWDFAGGVWPDLSGNADGVVGEGYEPGDIMPDFTVPDQHGGDVSLYQFYGYVTLVDLSAGWCGPCRTVANGAEAMWEEERENGFMVIHLMIDDNSYSGAVEDTGFMAEWATQYGIDFPVTQGDTSSAWQGLSQSSVFSNGIPFMVLLDQDMRLVEGYTGSGAEKTAFAKAKTLLGE